MDQAHSKKKILIVEDDYFIREMYSLPFKKEGFEVLEAADGVEAIQKVHDQKPEFVLLDLMLPRKDGMSVLREMNVGNDTVNIPVIVLTNLENPEKREEAKRLGAKDYLLKIMHTPSQVIEIVKSYLK